MPFVRKRRVVRRRRYGGIRRRIGFKPAEGLRQVYVRPANRRTHVFKRLGVEMQLTNTPAGNQPAWSTGNGCLALSSNTVDDYGTWQTGAAMNFMLRCCNEYTDFTQLFDRYKIVGVKLNFLYQSNISGINGGTRSPNPILTYSFDGDDGNAPADKTTVQVKQYAKTKLLNGNRTFSVFIKPRLDKLVYAGALSSAYTSERACWLDCSRSDVQHFGLKLWVNNWFSDADTSSSKLTIQPTYYIACKDSQ